MDRELLESLSKDQLIEIILEQGKLLERLVRRIEELEGKLGAPAKTPDNSSIPPSHSRKPSSGEDKPEGGRRRRKGRRGSHRTLDANPTHTLSLRAGHCQHCQAAVGDAQQSVCEAYDHVEIPPVQPVVTRVELLGGVCPCCRRRFKAAEPADMPSGSPFGPNLRALVIYLRYTHGISFERLARALHDLFGLVMSEGGLINLLKSAADAFTRQVSRIRASLLSSSALASDETGMRVGKRNFWLWVIHHMDNAVFRIDPSRAKRVLEDFLGDYRPDYWLSDRYSGQKGFSAKGHQFCLAHLIRDAQYAVDAGDDCLAPGLIVLFRRACRIGARRADLTNKQLTTYKRRFENRLGELLRKMPVAGEGLKLHRAISKIRRNLFLFVTNHQLEATNNASERALRPCVTFRKITNGFRTLWGADLYADIRSVIETARRRNIDPLKAITLTLMGEPLPPRRA